MGVPLCIAVIISALGLVNLSILDKRIWKTNRTLLLQTRRTIIFALVANVAIVVSGAAHGDIVPFSCVLANLFMTLFAYQIYETNFSTSTSAIRFNRNLFIPIIFTLAFVSLIFFNDLNDRTFRGPATLLLISFFAFASVVLGIKNWAQANRANHTFTIIWIGFTLILLMFIFNFPVDLEVGLLSIVFLFLSITLLTSFLFTSVSSLTLQLINQITEISQTDHLTGLKNRRYFFEHAEMLLAVANRQFKTCTIAIFDIDNFKSFNDLYGHDTGDQILKIFTDTMRDCFRDHELLVRWGGEEFLVFFPMTSASEAMVAAERLLDMLRSTQHDCDGQKITITASAGICELKRFSELNDAISTADQSLYRSKVNGKDQAQVANG